MATRPLKGLLVAIAALIACSGVRRAGAPRVYAQYADDSISGHCKFHPETCAGAFGPEGGGGVPAAATAGAPDATGLIQAVGTGILAASVVATAALGASEKAKVEEVLRSCADEAYGKVLDERYPDGRRPTAKDCNKQIGTNGRGEAVYLAMVLGDAMHQAALQCVRDRLGGLLPNRFSIEQRYRQNPRTGRTTIVTKEDEALLHQHGTGDELRYTIVPDVVIHKGDARYVQAVYDFKFPCPESNPPQWGEYPQGHPYFPKNQGDIYTLFLEQVARRVAPGRPIRP